jgi:putative intracellular protease/amidase
LEHHREHTPSTEIFYQDGHGPTWDLADDADSIALIESFYNSGKPGAAVWHAPAALC